MSAESVDTERMRLGLPAVVSMPTESAVALRGFAAQVVEAVRVWAPIAIDLEEADEARRRLAVWADMCRQLELDRESRLNLIEALRWTERVCGQCAKRYEAAGAEIDVDVPSGCYLWASYPDDAWRTALDVVRVAGTVKAADLSAALAAEGDALEQVRKFRMIELAQDGASSSTIAAQVHLDVEQVLERAAEWGLDIPGDAPPRPEKPADVLAYLDELVADQFRLAERAALIDRADLDGLDEARLRDTVTRIWDAAGPVVMLRARIERHLRR